MTQTLALRFGTNCFLLLDPLYLLVSQVPLFVLSTLLSSLWVSHTGSASDWCALQEALYKCIDTIQYDSYIHQCENNLPATTFILSILRIRWSISWCLASVAFLTPTKILISTVTRLKRAKNIEAQQIITVPHESLLDPTD